MNTFMSDSKLQPELNFEGYGRKQKWNFGMASFAQLFINSAFNTWVFSFYFTAVRLKALTITARSIDLSRETEGITADSVSIEHVEIKSDKEK